MTDVELREDTLIDLGQASVETKGQANFESDDGGGKLRYITGIADD